MPYLVSSSTCNVETIFVILIPKCSSITTTSPSANFLSFTSKSTVSPANFSNSTIEPFSSSSISLMKRRVLESSIETGRYTTPSNAVVSFLLTSSPETSKF